MKERPNVEDVRLRHLDRKAGRATTLRFLEAVTPQLAVGPGNRFGHPVPGVVGADVGRW